MPNKALLPGFSRGIIEQWKELEVTKEQAIKQINKLSKDYVERLKQNTIDVINEIWEQD